MILLEDKDYQMLKQRLEYILKHNTFIQFLYKKCVSAVIRFVGLFVRTDNHLVLFNSFGGRRFNDSPKVLFERMRDDPFFKEYSLVWAFERPEDFSIDRAKSIKIDTFEYIITALKARVWISSVNIERGLHYKKKHTIYINTWHGAGTKLIGNACSKRKDYIFTNIDIMLIQSEFEKNIFLRDFDCNPDAFMKVGFPRNDELFHISEEQKKGFRSRFGIPQGKKVILYAPTWRDSNNGGLSYEFIPPIHIEKWKERFARDYVMLFRMHAFTTAFKMEYDEFSIDTSSYDNLNHVLAIADVVVTDYSTIVYDSAIAGKPFICFGFDYERYKKERGFYYELNEVYPGGVLHTEEEVMDRIEAVLNGADADEYNAFREKYIEAGGSATDKVVAELKERLVKDRGNTR